VPCREEPSRTYHLRDGRTVTIILRDSVVVEDPYMNIARARALEARTGSDVTYGRIDRDIRDNLIKTNLAI
jgi:hypothetical protein